MDILVMLDVVANHVGYVESNKVVHQSDGFSLATKVEYIDDFS